MNRIYFEYLNEEAASDAAEEALAVEKALEEEYNLLRNMTEEETWIYYHGANWEAEKPASWNE